LPSALLVETSGENKNMGGLAAPLNFEGGAIRDLPTFLGLEPAEEPALLYSSTGEQLPPVEVMRSLKEYWETSTSNLGLLVAKTTLMPSIGCWTRLMWRNSEGYIRIRNPHRFGIPRMSNEEDESRGMVLHRLVYILRSIELGGEPHLPRSVDIDHVCRNTACGNPYHLRPLENSINNAMRLQARKAESFLASGQLQVGPIGIEWIDEKVEKSPREDTGIVVATREGPFKIMKADEDPVVLYARREPDEVFDALKPPAPNRRNFKSRARPYKHPKDQAVLVNKNRYKKKKQLTTQQKYKTAMAAQAA